MRKIKMADFKQSLKRIRPSVSLEFLRLFEEWNNKHGNTAETWRDERWKTILGLATITERLHKYFARFCAIAPGFILRLVTGTLSSFSPGDYWETNLSNKFFSSRDGRTFFTEGHIQNLTATEARIYRFKIFNKNFLHQLAQK